MKLSTKIIFLRLTSKTKRFIVLAIFFIPVHLDIKAQQNIENNMSQYFENRMMWNPGFTGVDGNKIYLLQNRGWMGFIGAPVISYIGGELTFGKNSAFGVQLMTDRAGLIQRNNEILSYSYRIKLAAEKKILIGISLNFMGERLNVKEFDPGGIPDPLIVNNSTKDLKVDGNLGFVFIDRQLTLGLSIDRIAENIQGSSNGNANLSMIKISGSFQIKMDKGGRIRVSPLGMLRMYRGTNSIADIGAQFEYDKFINSMLMYQTTGNVRTGVGLEIQKLVMANFYYNTNIRIANPASQQFEIAIGFKLGSGKRGS